MLVPHGVRGESRGELRVEVLLNVLGGELRQRVTTETRNQVDADHLLIAAIGARSDARLGAILQPAGEELPDCLALIGHREPCCCARRATFSFSATSLRVLP